MARTRSAVAFILAALIGLVPLPSLASQHAGFDDGQRQEIEEIVRDYILENPEILVEALQSLQEQQRLAQAERSQQQLAERREEILNDPGSPVGGNPSGDVTVVEFFDYQCPYCRAVAPRIDALLDEDRNIRFVYKEWPILGPASEFAAKAALAAWKQGRYEPFHNALMATKGKLSEKQVLDIARELDLDLDRLKQDMASAEIEESLRRTNSLAASLGINGTPAFVIGDALVPGAVELDTLRELVAQARDEG